MNNWNFIERLLPSIEKTTIGFTTVMINYIDSFSCGILALHLWVNPKFEDILTCPYILFANQDSVIEDYNCSGVVGEGDFSVEMTFMLMPGG